jgi:hypothetical protein
MPLSPELRKRLAAHVGADESATDDALLDSVAGELDARKSDIVSLTTEAGKVTALTRERDELKAKVDTATLELSSRPAAGALPDPMTLSLVSRLIRTEREQAIASGAISQAAATAIDGLFTFQGKPTSLALARAEGDTDPIACRVYEILKAHAGQGVKSNNGVTRTTIDASRSDGSPLDAGQAPALTPEQVKAEVDKNLALTELGRRALASQAK